jgi:hypothetical protein
MKGLASSIIIFTSAFLGWAIYRHFSGGAPVTVPEIVLICVAAPLAAAARWVRYDWLRKFTSRLARGGKEDREQP